MPEIRVQRHGNRSESARQCSTLIKKDEALRRLAEEDASAAKVVNLKFFVGLSHEAIAEMMSLSLHDVRTKWAYARAWLQVAIEK